METTKFKPFDLEAAKAGEPVMDRAERDVRIVDFNCRGRDNRPIVGIVDYGDYEFLSTFAIDGKCILNSDTDRNGDLVMKPEKKQVWKNFYIAHGSIICGAPEYLSQEEAEKYIEHNKADSTWKYLCTQIIEWEE